MGQKIEVAAVGDHPVAEDAAGLGPGLEHGDRKAGLGQLGRTTQPAGARSHHGDFFRPGLPFLDHLQVSLPGVLDQKALNLSDLDRWFHPVGPVIGTEAGAALFFTKPGRRAEHPAGAAEDVVGFDGPDRTGNIFQSEFADEGSRVGIGRASLGTGGIVAQQAAVGLGHRLGKVEPRFHSFKVVSVFHCQPSYGIDDCRAES